MIFLRSFQDCVQNRTCFQAANLFESFSKTQLFFYKKQKNHAQKHILGPKDIDVLFWKPAKKTSRCQRSFVGNFLRNYFQSLHFIPATC